MSSFSNALQQQDPSAVVYLDVNGNVIALMPNEYEGKTLTQLFTDFGSRLGTDVSRVTSFTINGQQVGATAVVRPGETVRGNVQTDSKQA
jgi:hypothetical protein